MSIDQILRQHLSKNRLFELRSLLTGDETARTMIVSADVWVAVSPPFPENAIGERLGEFRAWLDAFMEGAEISTSEDPDHKPPETMLARVHPVEADFWSIRVTLPEQTPGIRSLGAFADLDTFIALTWELREAIVDFDAQVGDAMDVWKDLFGPEKPHHGEDIHAYFSNCWPI